MQISSKDATCDFTATGTVTLTERILQPEEFQVNLQFCKQDFPIRLGSCTNGIFSI